MARSVVPIPPFAFHAAAPPGEWLNDPNGLITDAGGWRLWAQHRDDGPTFFRTGWARLSSVDGLRWRWDGIAIPAEHGRWAYSGCVIDAGHALHAWHTEHDGRVERQLSRVSTDGGLHWTAGVACAGPPARNRRDPFVIAYRGGWRMLLAQPCDWTDWAPGGRSTLEVLAADTLAGPWQTVGVIGPWSPPGVMWEVPWLRRDAGGWHLVVSTIDRRDGATRCGVESRPGVFDGHTFVPSEPAHPLDFGPDYYAACPSSDGQHVVAWASNWATAYAMRWPGDAHGGPITLARPLTAGGCTTAPSQAAAFSRAVHGVPAAGLARARVAGDFALTVRGENAVLRVTRAGTRLQVERAGDGALAWSAVHAVPAQPAQVLLFIDGALVELLLDGIGWTTAAVPGAAPLGVTLQGGELAWSELG